MLQSKFTTYSLSLLVSAFALTTTPILHASQENTQAIEVSLTEMKFEVKGHPRGMPLVLQVGQRYTMTFENIGQIKHEVLWGRPLSANHEGHAEYTEHLLTGLEVDVTGSNSDGGTFEIEAEGLKELELDPGTKLTVSFDLTEAHRGQWEMGCFVPGHYEMGMKLPIVVE